jgi:phosphatidylserine/phosphatidylglycerophosphate/cardiolipin synthase-like enzyme
VKILLFGGGFSPKNIEEDEKPSFRLVSELISIRNELLQNVFFTRKYLSMTRASCVKEQSKRNQMALDIKHSAVSDADAVAGLLFDEDYFTLTSELLKSATKSIRIIMFYMRYDSRGKTSLSDLLVEEVLAAKSRGVDVQVILDRDREGDVFRSRMINSNAFKALSEAGAVVIFDESDRATHTKLVVVDDQHVILGSHNWTEGSLKTYNDTSVYISSKALAKSYIYNFEERIKMLDN